MAYFAAVISLKTTIQRLQDSSQFSILPPSREILEFAYKVVRTVQEVLQNNEELIIKNCDNERVTSLTGQIREAAYKLEDALESHASDQYESLANKLYLDFEKVKEEINNFVETTKKIEKMMVEELSRPLPEEEDVVPLKIDDGKNSKMFGLSDEYDQLKDCLIRQSAHVSAFLSIVGMAGIGKTALALKYFNDPSVSSKFDSRVFVTIGPKYQYKKEKIMLSILDQMNHDVNKICMEEVEDLAEYISRSLQGRRCLIVFDDVWRRKDLEELGRLLPKDHSLIQVLVTSRQKDIAVGFSPWKDISQIFDGTGADIIIREKRFLNKEESWDLLREKVFGEGSLCPFQLEIPGKKIAEHCEGLPLTIVTVANILSNKEKTLEYWKKVAEKQTSVFTDAYDQMWDVLISSYNYLPQYIKPCFLYMGVFTEHYKIPTPKLVKLWHVEQVLNVDSVFNVEQVLNVEQILGKLFLESVIFDHEYFGARIKKCSVHSVFWHLCVKQATKEKFFHVVNHVSDFTKGIKDQRRLCVHNNVVFGIKAAPKSMESISVVRSLLCTGPHHQYPVPLTSCLKLLRVLDALTIRFYKFPIEVLKLVLLRYLALTYSGKVPSSVSELRGLEYLIVHRHLRINKSSGDSSYLPVEIWNMQELRHIQVMGGNLPVRDGAVLPNLLTLSKISVNSCSKEILERTPNLKKLGFQIELTPDGVEPLWCFDQFSHLYHLESLKCVVVNPQPRSHGVASFTTLPHNLRKLSLSGLGYPWQRIRTIAKLPWLRELKLRCYAFQGPVWEINEDEFPALGHLLLEDTDLVHWRANGRNCFESIQSVIIQHCYKLKEIPSLRRPKFLGGRRIRVVDCPSLGGFADGFTGASVHYSLTDEEIRAMAGFRRPQHETSSYYSRCLCLSNFFQAFSLFFSKIIRKLGFRE